MATLPLAGLRVVDLTHSWAGPHCTRLLADFGAEVIRVEYPKRLCMFRGGQTADQAYNRQPPWYQVNRNKYAITLDLAQPDQRQQLRDLVRQADVWVDNARAGVMAKHGFGYGEVSAINPAIIMLSMSAFGATGPYAGYCAYGAVIEAVSGIQSLTAYGGCERPERLREMDVVNGIGAFTAVLTALWHRQRTGEGQYIDMSQMELPTHALLGEHLLEQVMNGSHPPPLGNRHRDYAPQGCYPCQGNDRWLTITARTDDEWHSLCAVLGRPDWSADPRLATAAGRRRYHDELDEGITAWTRQRAAHAAMHALQQRGIPAGVVLDVAELSNDPHLAAREYFLVEEQSGQQTFIGAPFKLSGAYPRVRWRGPRLGQHNQEIITGLLGYAPAAVPTLQEGDIGTAYDPD